MFQRYEALGKLEPGSRILLLLSRLRSFHRSSNTLTKRGEHDCAAALHDMPLAASSTIFEGAIMMNLGVVVGLGTLGQDEFSVDGGGTHGPLMAEAAVLIIRNTLEDIYPVKERKNFSLYSKK